MKRTTNVFAGALLACGLVLATSLTALGQRPAHMPKGGHRAVSEPPTGPETSKDHEAFRGIATKLNTTPEALESAYQAAKTTNPKLTHGQFVAANMVAHNLGEKNPAITTQALLDGLRSGNSIGKTLVSLGLSAPEAKEAERQADRDAKTAGEQATEQPKSTQ